MFPLVTSELLVEQLIGGIPSVETPCQLIGVKTALIKAAKCTFSDWKRYINLVSGNVNLIPSKCLALQSYLVFLVLIMLATRKSTIEHEQSPFHNPFKPNSRKTSFV